MVASYKDPGGLRLWAPGIDLGIDLRLRFVSREIEDRTLRILQAYVWNSERHEVCWTDIPLEEEGDTE